MGAANVDRWSESTWPIFLGISCLAMKMIPAILPSELKPKMRHWFTTLTQSQKCRAYNGSTLVYPFLRNLIGSLSRGDDGLNLLE